METLEAPETQVLKAHADQTGQKDLRVTQVMLVPKVKLVLMGHLAKLVCLALRAKLVFKDGRVPQDR